MKKTICGLALSCFSLVVNAAFNMPTGNKVNFVIGDSSPNVSWNNISMTAPSSVSELNTKPYVDLQRRFSGRKILSSGTNKGNGAYKNFKNLVDYAATTKDFEYVYIMDEMFWTSTGDQIGYLENETLAAAKYVHSKGMKTVHTILPNTILNTNFKLNEINTYDVIAIDLYPSTLYSAETHGCKYNSNPVTNVLYCSYKKLRDMGFSGQVWYVYQGFVLKNEGRDSLIAKMKLQQETIQSAQSFGISGIVPFGLLFPPEFSEWDISQGIGSYIEEYVNPDFKQYNKYAKRYNIKTANPNSQFGYIEIDKLGNSFGSYVNKYCSYEGGSYQFDGVGNCLYKDGNWYPSTTKGVEIVSQQFSFSGSVNNVGIYSGKWFVVGTLEGGELSANISNGVMFGSVFLKDGNKLTDFKAE